MGLSEEDAIAKYGADDIEVYHSYVTPLEVTVAHRDDNASYAKLICVKSQNVGKRQFSWRTFCNALSRYAGKSCRVAHPRPQRWRDNSRLRHRTEIGRHESRL